DPIVARAFPRDAAVGDRVAVCRGPRWLTAGARAAALGNVQLTVGRRWAHDGAHAIRRAARPRASGFAREPARGPKRTSVTVEDELPFLPAVIRRQPGIAHHPAFVAAVSEQESAVENPTARHEEIVGI